MALTEIPIELSSTPGIVDNSNATAININSSENVIIGGTTAGDAAADNLTLVDSGNAGMTIQAGDTSYASLYFKDSASPNSGYIQYKQGDDFMRFATNGTERLRILSAGGITFNGDTAQANALDDYEEGTWTPALNGSGYTFGTHTGTYIKIGRVCTVVGKLVVSGVGTNTSNMGSLTGFPFAALNATNQFQTGVAREITTTGRLYVVQVNVNLTSGGINSMDGVASGSNEIFTTGEYCFSLTYITT